MKSAVYQKRIICNLGEYEYGEFLSSLKFENLPHPSRIIKFFIESYLAGDENARTIVENYKQRNKISGRLKKPYIEKQEVLAKKSKVLYDLNHEEIEDIYDILDETLPG